VWGRGFKKGPILTSHQPFTSQQLSGCQGLDPPPGGSVTKAPVLTSHQPFTNQKLSGCQGLDPPPRPVTKALLLTTASIVHRRRGLWRLTYLGVQESLFTDRIFDLFDADRNGSDRSRVCCTPSTVCGLFGCFKFPTMLSENCFFWFWD